MLVRKPVCILDDSVDDNTPQFNVFLPSHSVETDNKWLLGGLTLSQPDMVIPGRGAVQQTTSLVHCSDTFQFGEKDLEN